MGVSDTSIKAFKAIYDKLGDCQIEVYEALKELGSATNEEVAEYLGKKPHETSGRITELKNYNMVAVVGLGFNKSGCTAKKVAPCDINDFKLKEIANDCN